MNKVETYPEMNTKIVWLLRMIDDNPVCVYAAARIEELEAEREGLLEACEALLNILPTSDVKPESDAARVIEQARAALIEVERSEER